jgi:hypothetical protein
MKTLKTSRNFTGSPISFRTVSRLEGRKFPASLRDFITTDEFRNFSGQIKAGDVTCTWNMAVWQNGFWSLSGDFHDGGIVGGDFFAADFMLDSTNHIGARLEGSILDPLEDRDTTVTQDGSDPWVRENWSRFQSSGPSVKLHAAPAVGMIVENSLLLLVIAVGSVVLVGETIQNRRKWARRSQTNFDPSSPPPDGALAGIAVGEDDGLPHDGIG